MFLIERKHILYLMANGKAKLKDVISFNEYCELVKPRKVEVDTRSTDELMEEILSLKFE